MLARQKSLQLQINNNNNIKILTLPTQNRNDIVFGCPTVPEEYLRMSTTVDKFSGIMLLLLLN